MSERNEIAAENEYQNLVLLRGRVSKSPVSRILPSGDEVVEFRLIIDRTAAKSKANSRTDFDLIDLVIDQIVEDLETGDLTALVELLGFVDTNKLTGYLSDGNGKQPY